MYAAARVSRGLFSLVYKRPYYDVRPSMARRREEKNVNGTYTNPFLENYVKLIKSTNKKLLLLIRIRIVIEISFDDSLRASIVFYS